jgi:hypothetical protein
MFKKTKHTPFSYSIVETLFVAVVILNYILEKLSLHTSNGIVAFVIVLVLVLPIIYTLSQIIWTPMFIPYKKEAINTYKLHLQDGSRTKE